MPVVNNVTLQLTEAACKQLVASVKGSIHFSVDEVKRQEPRIGDAYAALDRRA